MKWKFNKKILGIPMVVSSVFLLVSCTQNVEDTSNARKHIDKIKQQFLERNLTKLKQFYPLDWKINDELAIDQLGIEQPVLSGQISVVYHVKNVLLNQGIVEIQIKFLHNYQHIDSKDIIVYGFKKQDQIIKEIDKVLEQINDEYQIINNNSVGEVTLKIEDFLDLRKLDLNGANLSINRISPNEEKNWIEIEIKAEKSRIFKTKTVFVKGFKTSDEKIDEQLSNILNQIASEQIITSNFLPNHFDGKLESLMELQNIDLNNVKISFNDILRDDEQGLIKAKMQIQKFARSNDKTITFKGFKTINKLFQEIKNYAGSFSKENAFDLKQFETNLPNEKWGTLLDKFIDYSKNKFDDIRVFNMIKWNISNPEDTIWHTQNLDSVFSTSIMFELKNNEKKYESKWMELHFKNIKLNEAEREIYQEKTKLEKFLLKKITSDFFEEKKVASLKAAFEGKDLSCEQIEKEFGIHFEQTTKDLVKITGQISGVFENKDDGQTKIIAINLTIQQKELFVKISSPLWIVFKN